MNSITKLQQDVISRIFAIKMQIAACPPGSFDEQFLRPILAGQGIALEWVLRELQNG
jgi:hypothetical protein